MINIDEQRKYNEQTANYDESACFSLFNMRSQRICSLNNNLTQIPVSSLFKI